jgi:DNA-binding response OmpR family regulator
MALWPSCPLVLLAEDEAIIAIDLEDALIEAGFAVAGPFSTCAQAEAWLQQGKPDAAILDHELKDGPCDSLISHLSVRGVPIVVFTAHDAPGTVDRANAAVVWLCKPVSFPSLLAQLREEMQSQRTRRGRVALGGVELRGRQ